jgi:hypothetical protein
MGPRFSGRPVHMARVMCQSYGPGLYVCSIRDLKHLVCIAWLGVHCRFERTAAKFFRKKIDRIRFPVHRSVCSDEVRTFAVKKGKAVPLRAWSGPEGSRKLRFPDFMTTAQDGGKVSLTHRPPSPPGNTLGTHFC